MALGKRRRERQLEAFVAASDLPKSPGHPFYTALNRLLAANGFRVGCGTGAEQAADGGLDGGDRNVGLALFRFNEPANDPLPAIGAALEDADPDCEAGC